MPAGDLVTEWPHHEVNAYLVGDDDPWQVEYADGWFGNLVNPHDTDLDLVDGAVAGVDVKAKRTITLSLYCDVGQAGTDADVTDAMDDLTAAWAPGVDTELHAWLPGLGHVKVTGRCRDLTFDNLQAIPDGWVTAQAMFLAHDPTVETVA